MSDYTIDQCVEILNDWSPGQFHILDQNDVSKEELIDLWLTAYAAVQHAYDQLTPYAKEVAFELTTRIASKLQSPQPFQRVQTNKQKPSPRSRHGYVYLVRSASSAYKIGRTRNPEDRQRTFGIQLPFEVDFIAIIETEDMYALERKLHNRFADRRLNGEWFNLTEADVEFIKGLAS